MAQHQWEGMAVILCSTDVWDEGLGILLACRRSKLRPEQHFNPSLMQKVVIFFPLGPCLHLGAPVSESPFFEGTQIKRGPLLPCLLPSWCSVIHGSFRVSRTTAGFSTFIVPGAVSSSSLWLQSRHWIANSAVPAGARLSKHALPSPCGFPTQDGRSAVSSSCLPRTPFLLAFS